MAAPIGSSVLLDVKFSSFNPETMQAIFEEVAKRGGTISFTHIGMASSSNGQVKELAKVTAATALSKIDFMHILKLPSVLKANVIEGLSNKELCAFKIALGKGSGIDSEYVPAFKSFQQMINPARKILAEILEEHSTWKATIATWKGVSIEDKVWLLQLYELKKFYNGTTFPIPQIKWVCEVIEKCDEPSERSPELLKQWRKGIENTLANIKEINFSNRRCGKSPSALSLLVNLEELVIRGSQLTGKPDVSRLVKLKELDLFENLLLDAPDVSQNVNLRSLNLSKNLLFTVPDVSQNTQLETLTLHDTSLTVPPDLSKNANLKYLNLQNNYLNRAPDISGNAQLLRLYLDRNRLTVPPDVRQNPELECISLTENKLTTIPDLSKNLKLRRIDLHGNPLSAEAIKQLKALQKERPSLIIDLFINK